MKIFLLVKISPNLPVFDELSLGWEVYGTVDHPAYPHHDVGVTGSGQNTLQGAGELRPSLGVAELVARLGDGAEEELVASQSLDGLDQHGVDPELQVVGELIGREEPDVLVDYDGAPAVVDAVPPVLPRQPRLLTLKQLPAIVRLDEISTLEPFHHTDSETILQFSTKEPIDYRTLFFRASLLSFTIACKHFSLKILFSNKDSSLSRL